MADDAASRAWEDAILATDDADLLAYEAARDRYWDGGMVDVAARAEALAVLRRIRGRGKFLPARS